MNRGFAPIVIAVIIGVVTLMTAGGGYGAYKYTKVVEEKRVAEEQLAEQKERELEQLREQVQEFESNNEAQNEARTTVVQEDNKDETSLETYFIKPDVANVRPCTDTTDSKCDPIGQYKQNAELRLPYSNVEEMPEWLSIKWNGDDAYLNKLVLSEESVSKTTVNTSSQQNQGSQTGQSTQVQVDNVVTNQVTQEPSGTYCNGRYWNECPQGQMFNCPQTGGEAYCSVPQTGTNYYSDTTTRVRRLIALNESFKDWLQDTSDELRDARKTLLGFPGGGLVGELRGATLDLLDGELSVVSGMSSFTNEQIATLEGILATLEANPTEFVDKATFEMIRTPESEEADINSSKKKINATVESINDGIQEINNTLWSLY